MDWIAGLMMQAQPTADSEVAFGMPVDAEKGARDSSSCRTKARCPQLSGWVFRHTQLATLTGKLGKGGPRPRTKAE